LGRHSGKKKENSQAQSQSKVFHTNVCELSQPASQAETLPWLTHRIDWNDSALVVMVTRVKSSVAEENCFTRGSIGSIADGRAVAQEQSFSKAG
jgi:hypothetical protein